MRKLIVSYTGCLYAMKSGKLSIKDLSTALFHFGCSREHAVDFDRKHKDSEDFANEARCFVWRREGEEIARAKHAEFVALIEKAEAENRVLWRATGEQQTYSKLSTFLSKHGYADVIGGTIPSENGNSYDHEYTYPGVTERVKSLRLDLEVIWQG